MGSARRCVYTAASNAFYRLHHHCDARIHLTTHHTPSLNALALGASPDSDETSRAMLITLLREQRIPRRQPRARSSSEATRSTLRTFRSASPTFPTTCSAFWRCAFSDPSLSCCTAYKTARSDTIYVRQLAIHTGSPSSCRFIVGPVTEDSRERTCCLATSNMSFRETSVLDGDRTRGLRSRPYVWLAKDFFPRVVLASCLHILRSRSY